MWLDVSLIQLSSLVQKRKLYQLFVGENYCSVCVCVFLKGYIYNDKTQNITRTFLQWLHCVAQLGLCFADCSLLLLASWFPGSHVFIGANDSVYFILKAPLNCVDVQRCFINLPCHCLWVALLNPSSTVCSDFSCCCCCKISSLALCCHRRWWWCL